MQHDNKLHLIGYASGIAGVDLESSKGPYQILGSSYLTEDDKKNIILATATILSPLQSTSLRLDEVVNEICVRIAKLTAQFSSQQQFFAVLGGDHSSAIGTWSGVYDAMHHQGDIGLIWIDAHMDSHTPETTESGRIHGMPLAALMGYGYPTLTTILHDTPKIKPENICLIGARSFEQGEAALLQRLNVKIYFMDEVKRRGLTTILPEAVKWVTQKTVCFGISLDLDAIDPSDAPGVNVPTPDGIFASELMQALTDIMANGKLVGMEIAEFNPVKDKNHLTEKYIISLLRMIIKARR